MPHANSIVWWSIVIVGAVFRGDLSSNGYEAGEMMLLRVSRKFSRQRTFK